jgi:hypothetical protein
MRRSRFTPYLLVTVLATGMLIPSPVVAALPADALLPDLGMAPLTNFRIERRPRGERWLRFSTVIVNVGSGPFEVVEYTNGAGELQVDQRVLTGSGSWANEPTAAVMYWSGDGHNHMHVRDLQEYVLVSQNGLERRYGEKHGFCFWDNYRYNTALPGYPANAVYTGSNSCQHLPDGTVVMGLSVGWGDQYPYYLVDQYIKISGLPAGEYTVTATADWANWFAETNNANNRTTARIRLSKNGVTVLDPGTGP